MLHCSPPPVSPGVYTLHDLRVLGRKQQWCPYFLARRMVAYANVVVWNYQYMIDPKVGGCCVCGRPHHLLLVCSVACRLCWCGWVAPAYSLGCQVARGC